MTKPVKQLMPPNVYSSSGQGSPAGVVPANTPSPCVYNLNINNLTAGDISKGMYEALSVARSTDLAAAIPTQPASAASTALTGELHCCHLLLPDCI